MTIQIYFSILLNMMVLMHDEYTTINYAVYTIMKLIKND